jgi:Ca2+-transporting ATPase
MQKGEESKIKITAEKISQLDVKDFKYHKMDAKDIISKLNSNYEQGLTSAEAASRLNQYGPNELEKEEETPLWEKIKEQFED